MSTPPPGNIVARIRQQLADGRADDDILQGLTASGLSRHAAEQFLASTRTNGRTPPAGGASSARSRFNPEPAVAATLGPAGGPSAPSMNASAGRALSGASLMVTVLIAEVWLSQAGYLQLRPRGQAAFGLACLIAIARACRSAWHETPTPWRAILTAVAVPVVCAVSLVGYSQVSPLVLDARAEEDAERFVAVERSAADRAAADEKREAADAARTERRSRDSAFQLARLKDRKRRDLQCSAATNLGATKLPEYVPVLYEVLRNESDSVKECAAAGLVALGEQLSMLGVYDEWARGSNRELARAAISGFGSIGPPGAARALPYIATVLDSEDWVERYEAVEALTALGPEARPLLERASQDTHAQVRDRALHGLDPSRAQRAWAAQRRAQQR